MAALNFAREGHALKLWKMVAMIVALGALAVPSWAQTSAQVGQSTYGINQAQMNGGRVEGGDVMQDLQFDSEGNLLSSNRTGNPQLWNAVIVTNLAVGAADSSIVLDVHKYSYLKLLIKAIPRGGANTTVRLGIQFREMMNGNVDSTSVFAEYTGGRSDMGVLAGTSGTDSTFAGHIVTGSATTPWSGEYTLTFNGNRSAVPAGVVASVYSYPNGVSIPLDTMFGRQVRFNRLQVRIRNMNANSPGVDVTSYIMGFAR